MGRTANTPENAPEVQSSAAPAVDYEERFEKMEKLILKQNEMLEAQSKVLDEKTKKLEELQASLEAQSKGKLQKLPQAVIENEARMREKVKVYVTMNPLDPGSTHVPVFNPITRKIDQVKRGEEVEVSRAVYEILQNSMKSDKNSALIATELAEQFKEDTENL